jgi:hypothetical protein
MWERIAQTYANDPTIAGYDIMNEPTANWLSYDPAAASWSFSYLEQFYLRVIASIRSVDANHIIFLEPTGADEYKTWMPSEFPARDKIVWSPHFYPIAWDSHYSSSEITTLTNVLQQDYTEFVVGYGTPMWYGEYGAYMNDSSYLDWLHDAVSLFKEYHVGSAWWPYSGGPGPQIPAPVAAQ